jgi:hypothetical protein
MTDDQVLELCQSRGIPYHILADGTVQCLDLSLIAGGLREQFTAIGTLKAAATVARARKDQAS